MESEGEALPKTPAQDGAGEPRVRRRRRLRPETEEEALIRRFHDAQRMARFRARRRQALEERRLAGRGEPSGAVPPAEEETETRRLPSPGRDGPEPGGKYAQLLEMLAWLGRDVRLAYAGSRSSSERLKAAIGRARSLVRDCLAETRMNFRQ